jgi:hypothetical protein
MGFGKDVQFKATKTGCSSHGISVCVDICGGNPFRQKVETTLLVADSIEGIEAVICCVRNDLVLGDFGGQERERDNPENAGENVKSKYGPVVVQCRYGNRCNDIVDDDYHGCQGLCVLLVTADL